MKKVFNISFENGIPSRSIVADNFDKAYAVLPDNEKRQIKSVYTSDAYVVD